MSVGDRSPRIADGKVRGRDLYENAGAGTARPSP